MRRRVFLSGAILTGVGLPLLAGCKLPWQSKRQTGSTSASASAGKASGTAVPAASAAPQGWQELDAHVMGHHLGFQVSPLVRRDEKTTVLVLKLTRAKDDPAVKDVVVDSLDKDSNVFNAAYSLARPGSNPAFEPAAGGVRLLDLSTNRVWVATTGVENKVKGNNNKLSLKPGASTSCFVLFGPVDAKEVTVFVPQAGFVTVNVLDSSAAAASGIDFKAIDKAFDSATMPHTRDKADPKQVLEAPVPIERYTKALDDSTSTHTGSKDITVTLASDVTFASDSADLTSAADAQLQTVAGQLAQYPDGGTLTIVGHTDDVQDDAYNQTLSEKRANAVKTRLEQLTSLDKWQTSVSGKGESQPKINDTTDQARAANRRVEITLTPTSGTTKKGSSPTPDSSDASTLPASEGPSAKGSDGVTVTAKSANSNGEVTITLDHVTRQGGYLVGTLTCTVKPSSHSANLTVLLTDLENRSGNQRDEDTGSTATFMATDGLTLISGNERVFPADYEQADIKAHIPLTELYVGDELLGGTVTAVGVVWPDPGGDTITLDHAAPRKEVAELAFRLTDIPIKNS